MSARFPGHALDAVAQKWRALAERRRAHFIDLHESGRWKHYYTEPEIQRCVHQAIRQAERWAEIAPRPGDEAFAEQAAVEEIFTPPELLRRTAA